MKKLIFICLTLISSALYAQSSGTIKGTVFDENGEPLPYANVYMERGAFKMGGISDNDGNFTIKPIPTGKYDVNISFTGYETKTVKGVVVNADNITFLNKIKMSMNPEIIDIDIEIIGHQVDLINPEETSKMTILGAELDKMAGTQSIPDMLRAISSDVQVSNNGKDVIFRGARSGTSAFFIDGVKSGDFSATLPSGVIKSFTIYSGGIPAKYGDITGGIVVVETKSYFDIFNEHRND
ncbi:MAG: hypothetical protein A2046_03205 [Bacteroidetes bacterium GWA2_30_7]|nr:MAG: hypothetical protein A2046_03205 [Bacteroidetes bacterium GWA2_30_7]